MLTADRQGSVLTGPAVRASPGRGRLIPGRGRLSGGRLGGLMVLAAAAAGCAGGVNHPGAVQPGATASEPPSAAARPVTITSASPPTTVVPVDSEPPVAGPPLPAPAGLAPFVSPSAAGEGVWRPAGRFVLGRPALYETELRAPGSGSWAGLAWMDTRLLAARLYSGSDQSPGPGAWQYTAAIQPPAASTLVAAFNGGFKMPAAEGGYYTQGTWAVPARPGAASLVIYSDGTARVGAWGTDVSMTGNVVAVRQNLHLLVSGGQPASDAGAVGDWGATLGQVSSTWRSGLGQTASGALVYVVGPGLDPLALAELLIRAGAVNAMELDINPEWTVMVTYTPPAAGLAAPSNGTDLLPGTMQGPSTFFDSRWARDFITLSARSGRA
ncbi:MAG: phosphodiester glycosidase family protein [Acidimicrobiales bacterium]